MVLRLWRRALKRHAPALLLLVWLLRRLWRRRFRCLKLTAPLRAAGVKYGRVKGEAWEASCPCCKRPLAITFGEPPVVPTAKRPRCCFLICLWGKSAEYVLGAMVLGASIRKTKSVHERVCLYTEDVPMEHVRQLSKLWQMRLISHLEVAMDKLSFPENEERFAKVFTKLRGLELAEYDKVLMMDIDLLVRSNIDELFDLPAPAAMRRGMNEWGLSRHGRPIDGRVFFLGEDKSQPRWSWGQGTGINAGVMLWRPSEDVFEEMVAELSEPNHPEHVKGNGPEQDYLSRFWADAPWTYIGAQYNFQLHQMFFSLHPDRCRYAERANLLKNPDEIKIVHYSGKPTAKPWHRVLDEAWKDFWPGRHRDAEYTLLFAEEFMGYWLWIKRDRDKFEAQSQGWDMSGMEMTEDGNFIRRSGDREDLLEIPEAVSKGAMALLSSVLKEWFDLFQALELEFGIDLRHLRQAKAPKAVCPRPLRHTAWRRHRGWWAESDKAEREKCDFGKLTVTCGASSESAFVSLRDGSSTFEEHGFDVTGLFIKMQGQTAARNFSLDELSPDGLLPVRLWVDGVPPGAIILTAIVNVEGDLQPVLEALQPLNVPQGVPPANTQVVACISVAGEGTDLPCANHASPDIAYASLLEVK